MTWTSMGEWLSSATAGCKEAAGYQQHGPLQRSQMLTNPAFSRCLAGVFSQPVVTPAQRSLQERRSRVYADREARVCAVLHAGLTCLPRLHLSKLSGPVFKTRGSYRIQSFSALAESRKHPAVKLPAPLQAGHGLTPACARAGLLRQSWQH